MSRLIRPEDLLTREEEYALIRRAQAGNRRAMDEVIVRFGPLAESMARKRHRFGIPVEDLEQEAREGLFEALQRFEIDRGFRFSTFAYWRVLAKVNAYCMRNWSIVSTGRGLNTVREMYAAIGTIPDRALDAPISAMSSGTSVVMGTLLDRTPDTGPLPDAITLANEDRALKSGRIAWMMRHSGLTAQEKDVFTQRWLFDGDFDAPTLETIAGQYGVSRERVRQIEVRALTKLGLADALRPTRASRLARAVDTTAASG